MFSKRLAAFLLACCALFPLPGCETEDDRYFNSLVAERKEQLSLEEEGPWRPWNTTTRSTSRSLSTR